MRSTLHLPACEAYKVVPLRDPQPGYETQPDVVAAPAATAPTPAPSPAIEVVVANRLTGHAVA
ncbi:MAG: hypothetical protein ACTHNU_12455 [Gaiellales bacterium]